MRRPGAVPPTEREREREVGTVGEEERDGVCVCDICMYACIHIWRERQTDRQREDRRGGGKKRQKDTQTEI